MKSENLEQKIKTLCHQNYIGSNKCGECDGKYIDKSKLNKIEFLGRDISCPTCKGKGYTIPLEFGCEVNVRTKTFNEDEYSYRKNMVLGVNPEVELSLNNWELVENKGKPLTLQMVLMLLNKKGDYPFLMDDKTLFHVDEQATPKLIATLDIDLTKDLKDQPEVLQAVIEIVK